MRGLDISNEGVGYNVLRERVDSRLQSAVLDMILDKRRTEGNSYKLCRALNRLNMFFLIPVVYALIYPGPS